MMDRMGVMPLPPAMPTWWRRDVGSMGTKKRPCGAITCTVSPTFRCWWIQVEKAPPLTRRTATRSSPSSTPAQIEYERRRSSPAMVLRRVRYWPWVKPNASRRLSGTEKETIRDSGVSASMALTGRGWNMTLMAVSLESWCYRNAEWTAWQPGSDRLEVLKGLAAAHAAVQRLAGGGAESPQALGLQTAAARAGQSPARRRAPHEVHGHALAEVHRARRRDAVVEQLLAPLGADPVGGPGRGTAHRDARRAQAGGGHRRQHVLFDQLGGGAARVGGREHDLQPIVVGQHLTHQAQVDHRQRRHLGVEHGAQHLPDRAQSAACTAGGDHGSLVHHTPPGKARCRYCISARMKPMCSECTPRRPVLRYTESAGTGSFTAASRVAISARQSACSSDHFGPRPLAAACSAMAASSASLEADRRCHISFRNVASMALRSTVKAKSPRGSSTRVGLR